MPYLTGDSLPAETICGRLFIPNDKQVIANVCGALLDLTKAYNWEQFGATTVAETIIAMTVMVNGFMEDTCEDCNMQLRADPENPCILQQSLDGETWETLLDASGCGAEGPPGADGSDGLPGSTGAAGAAGADGADGVDGENGTDGANGGVESPGPNPGEASAGLKCAVSVNLTKYLRSQWGAMYGGQIQDAQQAVATAALPAVSLIGILFPGFAIIAATALLVYNIAIEIGERISQAEANNFDDEAEERFRCFLFCLLGNDGVITTEILSDWSDAIRADTAMDSAYAGLIADFLETFPFAALEWVAFTSSAINPDACDCDDCPAPWAYLWDLTADDGGFAPYSAIGTYVASVGWQSVGGQVTIQQSVDPGAHFRVSFGVTVGSGLGGSNHGDVLSEDFGTILTTGGLVEGTNTFTWTGDPDAPRSDNPWLSAYNNGSAVMTITSARIDGVGTLPAFTGGAWL